jgi:hypothetical protein
MLRIISLMNEKNHYLEKFYALNETELKNFSVGIFDNLERFYQTREKILDIVKYIDSEVDKAHGDLDYASAVATEDKRAIRAALSIKDEYVTRIIEQDLEVLSCIETAKNGIIRDLQDVQKSRRGIGGYKSPSFTQRLDEEA